MEFYKIPSSSFMELGSESSFNQGSLMKKYNAAVLSVSNSFQYFLKSKYLSKFDTNDFGIVIVFVGLCY